MQLLFDVLSDPSPSLEEDMDSKWEKKFWYQNSSSFFDEFHISALRFASLIRLEKTKLWEEFVYKLWRRKVYKYLGKT